MICSTIFIFTIAEVDFVTTYQCQNCYDNISIIHFIYITIIDNNY